MLLASSLFAVTAEAAPLKVMTMGLGSGSVTGAGITCNANGGPDCDEAVPAATVTLTATPAAGSIFVGWNTDLDADLSSTPDCTGTLPTCSVTTAQARSVKATFDLSPGINPIAAVDPSNITPEEIETYLNNPANAATNTVARFVAALPSEYRQSAIMMTRSESLQTGTAQHPRILLSSDNAMSVFSIGPAVHSAYPGSHPDVIEYMQWDAATKNFRFHEIILTSIPAMGSIPPRVRKIEKDDLKCSSCHSTRNVVNTSDIPGTDGMPIGVIKTKNKPNWDPYDSWGGMLPFNRDRLYQGSLDTAAFRKLYNPWTWRNTHAIRSLVEQLRLQPPGVPVLDRITRFRGGANDGTPRLSFDTSPPVTVEPVPSGSGTINTAYNFNNGLTGLPTSVTRAGTFVTLYHLSQTSGGEGRGVQLFDLAGGLDGNLNQLRVADELASHRWATGNVLIDPRPVALAITRGCLTIDSVNNQVTSSFGALTFSQAFFTARHGGSGINSIFNDTMTRTRSVPRRKVDIQKFNLDRTGDIYTLLPGTVPGLIQQHGAATSAGTSTTLARLRQEAFRRDIDLGSPDVTNMNGIFVDREDYNPNTTRMALYRYFLEPLGVSVDKWSMGVRGRSRTYAFADVFGSYTSALQSALIADLTADPYPGLTTFTCGANLIAAVNNSLATLPAVNAVPTYTDIQRIFNKSCVECHGGLEYPPYVNYGTGLNLAENQVGPGVDPLAQSYNLAQPMATSLLGPLYDRITRTSEGCPGGMMPCGGPPLSQADIDTIKRWIQGGTPSTWGDPHLTTIDGVRYDFQSAGEFVLLRDPGMEIQARHMPVQTEGPVGPDAHTGLTSCVSIMTAVAVRVGPHRITYQMNPELREGLELRVDGKPVQLGTELLLSAGGRIIRTPSQGGIQIESPGGSRIIITVDWWAHYQVWYMNVSVQQARATEGLLGAIGPGNWLPALSDGTRLGPRPASLYDRYVDLYEKFEDSWRVTDTSSLFDYPAGFSTASYTLKHWPEYKAESCKVTEVPPGIPVAEALPSIPMEQAFEFCRDVKHEVRRQQCAQDVAGTGDPIFARTFVESEKVEANIHPEPLALVGPKDFSIAPATVTFQWERTFDKDQDVVLYRHCVWHVNTAFTFRACNTKPTQELSRTVTLEPGRDYFWKVLAEDGRGGISESKTWRFTAK